MRSNDLDAKLKQYQAQIDILKESGFSKIEEAGYELQELLDKYAELVDLLMML